MRKKTVNSAKKAGWQWFEWEILGAWKEGIETVRMVLKFLGLEKY
jgi:hypothetical protein